MRTIFVEISRETSRWEFTHPRQDVIRTWVDQATDLGFQSVVLLGDHLLSRDDLWELCDGVQKMADRLRVGISGDLWQRTDRRRLVGDPFVPVDWVDPITERRYGAQDYGKHMQQMVQMIPDPEIWVTIDGNRDLLRQFAELDARLIGHTDTPPDDELRELADELIPPEAWMFIHEETGVPEIPVYEREIVQNNARYYGTIHIDIGGRVRTQHGGPVPIGSLTRDTLTDLAYVSDRK